MKTKLTLTIDEELVPLAKEYARAQGVSLSQLVEESLRASSAGERGSFSQRWRGKFVAAEHHDHRYETLAKRYL